MNEKRKPPRLSLSTEEAQEIGRKGGIASGEARRIKKAMREAAQEILSAKPQVAKSMLAQIKAMGVGADDVDVQMISLLMVARKAMKGDIAALVFLRDTAGEKPSEKIDASHTMGGDFVLIIGDE